MNSYKPLKVVVGSPSDVKKERNSLDKVIEKINNNYAHDCGLHLEVVAWEKYAYPGFDFSGPQGLIDKVLKIKDCDIFIGIFWKKFGTPTKYDGMTGTEHEFNQVYETWKKKKNNKPHIMFYFNQKEYYPTSIEESEQQTTVLRFKKNFPKEGLWWSYKGVNNFKELVESHIRNYLKTVLATTRKKTRRAQEKNSKIKDWTDFRHDKKITKTDMDKHRINLSQKNLENLDLSHMDLSGMDLSCKILSGSNLKYSNLVNTNLHLSELVSTDLSNANLKGAKLTGCRMVGANLTNANLENTSCYDANLDLVTLVNANLMHANLCVSLQDANLTGANISFADLHNAVLTGANFSKTILCSLEDYEDMKINNNTWFINAITNEEKLVNYLRTKNPMVNAMKLENKEQIVNFMQKNDFSESVINFIKNSYDEVFILQQQISISSKYTYLSQG